MQLLRYFRIALGAFIIAEGYSSGDGLFYFLGGLFLAQGILNVGCGLGTSCNVNSETNNQQEKEISFEEVGKK